MVTVTFSYRRDYMDDLLEYEWNKKNSVFIERTLNGDDAEVLPRILEEFHYFLQGMTFNYIDKIEAHTDSGMTFSSTED